MAKAIAAAGAAAVVLATVAVAYASAHEVEVCRAERLATSCEEDVHWPWEDSLDVPPGTPSWVARAATDLARDLEDPEPEGVTVAVGRYMVVTLYGDFRCAGCGRPSGNTLVPTAPVAQVRLDSETRAAADFALGDDPPYPVGDTTNRCGVPSRAAGGDCIGRGQ